MFVLRNYAAAVVFCVITMLCWGSWANTQKLAGGTWRFELFYWDYVFGVLLMALIFAFTMGSKGGAGRNFLADLRQAEKSHLRSAFLGGMVFNAANILLVAAIAVAGLAVAFPVGIGLALVIGVLVNYWAEPKGEPIKLFSGVALITVAIIVDAWAYGTLPGQSKGVGAVGLGLALLCGVLMGFFYRFVAAAMPEPKPENFIHMPPGKLSPYSAMVLFSLGILASQVLFNFANILGALTQVPPGTPDYFSGGALVHLWGLLGGMIWAVGMTFSIIAFGRAGPAISYGLGQGATMVAAFWGVFIWREFRDAPPGTGILIWLMFAGYILGLGLIILAGTKREEEPSVEEPS
jgi:glucose uptake protein